MRLLIFILLFLSISCQKKHDNNYRKIISKNGLIVHRNIGANYPTLKYTFSLLGEIPFSSFDDKWKINNTENLCVDDSGYIYVADSKTAKINKFSPSFKFITSFGGKGNGPGEFPGHPFSLLYFKNSIIAPCSSGNVTNIFSTKGNFIKKIPYNLTIGISGLTKFGDNIVAQLEYYKMFNSELRLNSEVVILDSSLTTIKKTLFSTQKNTEKRHMRLDDTYIRFTVTTENIYIAYPSENKYSIMVYNKNGDKIAKINKSYLPIENKKLNSFDIFGFTNNGADFFQKKNTPWKNKTINYKSITYLFNDKFSRLWVLSPATYDSGKNVLFDVFEDGVLMNSISVDFLKKNDFDYIYSPIFFYKNNILYINLEEEKIEIYSYKSSKL